MSKPTIKEWDQKELLSSDIDERSETWLVEGYDDEGNKFEGVADFTCGEMGEVEEIELVMPKI